MSTRKTIRVPASTTNLGSGFDTLGMALKLYLRVEIQKSTQPRHEIVLEGEGSRELPNNEENLLWKVVRRVFEGEGHELPATHFHISNEIPLARGLGSSAAAIVAGISCFEVLTGIDLDQEKFFRYAFEFENHPDNITAARYGGFTVSCVDEKEQITFFRSTLDPRMKFLLVVPEFQLQTKKARAVIPRSLSLRDAIFNIQRSCLMVAALLSNQSHLLREGLRDKLHQPFRSPLIPGLQEILSLQEAGIPGLLGICLSGAGPSVLVFAETNLDGIYQQIRRIFARHHLDSRTFELEVDNQGRIID